MYDRVIEILVADCDANFLNSFCDYANGQIDFNVVDYVNSGEEVLPSIKKNTPDVLLIDALLPVVDGIGVLRRLQDYPDIRPIVIMASYLSQDIYVQTAMSLGADYYMLKPVNFEFLFEQIRFLSRGINSNFATSIQPSGVNSLIYDNQALSESVTQILHELGIPAHLYGHHYLREAILMVLRDRNMSSKLNKSIYPIIGRKYGKSAASVEKAMRNALDTAWLRGKTELLDDLFSYTISVNKGRATNSEFIALIADKLSIKYSC